LEALPSRLPKAKDVQQLFVPVDLIETLGGIGHRTKWSSVSVQGKQEKTAQNCFVVDIKL